MIIYSVTIKIDLSAHDEWLNWMKTEHISEVIGTGKFVSASFNRILQQDETDGISYNVQYKAHSMSDYFDYIENFATALQQKGNAKFEGKFVAFRTLLREVEF